MHVTAHFDWKSLDDEAADTLRDTLKHLGVFTYRDPRCEGCDTVGLIFSDELLDDDDLADLVENN